MRVQSLLDDFKTPKEPFETATPSRAGDIRKRLRWSMKTENSEKMHISPEDAVVMLELNDRNRPLSKARVKKYANYMKRGEWHYTRVPIIFSQDRLIDGQTRLAACVESGVTIVCDVVFGADDQAFFFIDTGSARTAGDIFAINDVPNANMAAAATRFIMGYQAGSTGGESAQGHISPTLAEVYDTYVGLDRLQDSLKIGRAFASDKLPAASTASGVHWLCAQKNRREANAYFERIASGVGFESRKDPAYKVREWLVRPDERPTRKMVASVLSQGWESVRTKKPMGRVDPHKIRRII